MAIRPRAARSPGLSWVTGQLHTSEAHDVTANLIPSSPSSRTFTPCAPRFVENGLLGSGRLPEADGTIAPDTGRRIGTASLGRSLPPANAQLCARAVRTPDPRPTQAFRRTYGRRLHSRLRRSRQHR